MIYYVNQPAPRGPRYLYKGTKCEGGQKPSFFTPMTDPYRAFLSQRSGAKARGIGWELTYEQWLEFWGDDLPRRGRGRHNLSMQRPCDSGPYAVGNIRKGTPAENMATKAAMYLKPGAVTRIMDRKYQSDEDGPDLGYASVWRLYG